MQNKFYVQCNLEKSVRRSTLSVFTASCNASEQKVNLHQLHHPSIYYSINICLSLKETDLILRGIHILFGPKSKTFFTIFHNQACIKYLHVTTRLPLHFLLKLGNDPTEILDYERQIFTLFERNFCPTQETRFFKVFMKYVNPPHKPFCYIRIILFPFPHKKTKDRRLAFFDIHPVSFEGGRSIC